MQEFRAKDSITVGRSESDLLDFYTLETKELFTRSILFTKTERSRAKGESGKKCENYAKVRFESS